MKKHCPFLVFFIALCAPSFAQVELPILRTQTADLSIKDGDKINKRKSATFYSDIADEFEVYRKCRYLDKLVDELAKGRKMEKICARKRNKPMRSDNNRKHQDIETPVSNTHYPT